MDLTCIDGSIRFRTPCGSDPFVRSTWDIYFEDLPGMSAASLAAMEPGKYMSAKQFAAEKLRFAGQLVLDKLRNHLEQYVTERGAKEDGEVGTFGDDTLAGSANPRGLRVKVDGGAMLVAHIPRIYIKSAVDVTDLVVKVSDRDREVTFTTSVEAGVEKELYIGFESNRKQVDIVIEDDRFAPYGGSTQGTVYFSTCNTCGSNVGRYEFITGTALNNEVEDSNLYGIRCEAVALCSLAPVACVLLQRYRHAVLWQWGILILEDNQLSPRTNYWSLHTKEAQAAFIEQWNTVELPRAMKTPNEGFAAFVRSLDPHCLTCGVGATSASGT